MSQWNDLEQTTPEIEEQERGSYKESYGQRTADGRPQMADGGRM